jgi:hypothetical protein
MASQKIARTAIEFAARKVVVIGSPRVAIVAGQKAALLPTGIAETKVLARKCAARKVVVIGSPRVAIAAGQKAALLPTEIAV